MYTEIARRHAKESLAEAEWVDRALEGVDGLDPLNIVLNWEYDEPYGMIDQTVDERRTAAIEWLRLYNRGIQAIARHGRLVGADVDVRKVANEWNYGLSVVVRDRDLFLMVKAVVAASLTCEMVPTGEVETRDVMERRCPESIFAGIESEVDA